VNVKFSSFVVSASVLLFCSVSAVALADGMPFEQPQPKPNLTPINQSLTAPAAAPAAAAAAPAPAPAAPAPLPPPVPESRVVDVQPDTSFFGLSVGMYDPFTHSSKSTAFNAEWQPGVKILGTLQPLFGAMATTKNALLGYAGVGVPFNIVDHVFLMPSVAVGYYKPGDDYDLGRKVVGRIGTELAYQFDDKSRIGLNIDALTNATSLQGRDRTEMVLLTYTLPLNAPVQTPDQPPVIQAPVKATATPVPMQNGAIAPLQVPASPAAATPTAKPLPNELP